MRVALDLEDVLVENVAVFVEELNRFVEENHGKNVEFSVQDVDNWGFGSLKRKLAEIRGWDSKVSEKFYYGDSEEWAGWYPLTKEIWRNKPEKLEKAEEDIEGCVKRLRRFVEENNGDLYIVTANNSIGSNLERKIENLNIKRFIDGVIIEKEKEDLDFDIYIDDHPKLHKDLDGSFQVMVTRPWNRNEELRAPHRRAENLKEAVEVSQDLG
ncbi:MAG: hypothetical protein ABEJ93_03760 [Candidatus Nanohalobium sp.]